MTSTMFHRQSFLSAAWADFHFVSLWERSYHFPLPAGNVRLCQKRGLITGSIAEASMNPANLIGGFWVFVYGLMVYLPACTVPVDRGAKPVRWWHYPLAVILPLLAAVPVVPVVIPVRQWLGIELSPGT